MSVKPAPPPPPPPRERMVFAATQLIRRQGVSGTGLREVVAEAAAPRGSLQHYFPGGKDQLVREAVLWAGEYAASRVARYVREAEHPTPGGLLEAIARQWTSKWERHGFAAGCPLVAAAADTAAANDELREAVRDAFAAWRVPLVDALVEMGVPTSRADPLAVLIVSALEGAIVLARTAQDPAPLRAVVRELRPLLDGAVVPGSPARA